MATDLPQSGNGKRAFVIAEHIKIKMLVNMHIYNSGSNFTKNIVIQQQGNGKFCPLFCPQALCWFVTINVLESYTVYLYILITLYF